MFESWITEIGKKSLNIKFGLVQACRNDVVYWFGTWPKYTVCMCVACWRRQLGTDLVRKARGLAMDCVIDRQHMQWIVKPVFVRGCGNWHML